MELPRKNVIYRVRVLFYNEFCGCSGEKLVNEWHYTTIAAAKVKIEEVKKQFKTGKYKIDEYTFCGEYQEGINSIISYFDCYNRTNFEKEEIVLVKKHPMEDLEFLHMLVKPERIVVEDVEVQEDFDGEPIFESKDELRFRIPLRGEDVIAKDLGLEPYKYNNLH